MKRQKKLKPAGVMRNDLEGSMRVRGKKISIRYKQKEFATGYENTPMGWKLANDWWAIKLKDLQAIQAGEKQVEDTIQNIFNQFLEYKRTITKITKKTETYYLTGFKAIITEPNIILTEPNIINQVERYIKTATVTSNSINIYLRSIAGFLNWCSDDNQKYLPKKDYITKYKQKEIIEDKADFTVEEYQIFLGYFETRNYEMFLLIQFLWLTGARIGETLSIKVSDIDFTKRRIKVANKVHKGKQEFIMLTKEAIELLEKTVKLANERTDKKLFSWKDTKLPSNILKRAEKNSNTKIKGRGLHGFRRSFTHKLVDAEVSVPILQDTLRHKSIETTMKHYNKYRPSAILKELDEKL